MNLLKPKQELAKLLKITMRCPYCLHEAKLKITSFNRTVQCPFCVNQFVATPFGEEKDLLRMNAACTRTLRIYRLVWERVNGLYTVKAILPNTGGSGSVQKIKEIPTAEMRWSSFRCPDCGEIGCLDHCSPCETWLCRGGATRLPNGVIRTRCPNDGVWEGTRPVVSVPLFDSLPVNNSPALALPAPTGGVRR